MIEIKSMHILKKILLFLEPKKYLSLIKYNKEIQKKMNISIKDYKEYNQIEIEVTSINNNFSGKVIDFYEENKEYYHIYFDYERKKENFISSKDNISKIKIIIDCEIKSLEGLFKNCNYISDVNFIKFKRKDINNMSYMFSGCKFLININFSKFNTSGVIDMSYMFEDCTSLKELNLSNFNTFNLTDMSYMFKNCSSLKELNLSNFNTSNVINMRYMFYNCISLKELNISNLDISQVTNMNYMFYNCNSLKNLNVSNFVFKDNIKTDYMFSCCSEYLKNEIRRQNKRIKENAFKEHKINTYFFKSLSEHENFENDFFIEANNEYEEHFPTFNIEHEKYLHFDDEDD